MTKARDWMEEFFFEEGVEVIVKDMVVKNLMIISHWIDILVIS